MMTQKIRIRGKDGWLVQVYGENLTDKRASLIVPLDIVVSPGFL
jgi:hypothetical protein